MPYAPTVDNSYMPANINLSNNGIFSEDPLFNSDSTLD